MKELKTGTVTVNFRKCKLFFCYDKLKLLPTLPLNNQFIRSIRYFIFCSFYLETFLRANEIYRVHRNSSDKEKSKIHQIISRLKPNSPSRKMLPKGARAEVTVFHSSRVETISKIANFH